MAPEPGVEYPLILGTTMLAADEPCTYVSMRYDFKPASAAGRHDSGVYSRWHEQVPPPPPASRPRSFTSPGRCTHHNAWTRYCILPLI